MHYIVRKVLQVLSFMKQGDGEDSGIVSSGPLSVFILLFLFFCLLGSKSQGEYGPFPNTPAPTHTHNTHKKKEEGTKEGSVG